MKLDRKTSGRLLQLVERVERWEGIVNYVTGEEGEKIEESC